jgi:hypothetical protein
VDTLLDTTVFIDLERAVRPLSAANAMAEVSGRLEGQLGPDDEVGIATITASETGPWSGRARSGVAYRQSLTRPPDGLPSVGDPRALDQDSATSGVRRLLAFGARS